MDFKCEGKVDLFYFILSLSSLAFNITTSYFIPNFYEYESDSCTEQIIKVIKFCNRLKNTILAFGIIISVYFFISFCMLCLQLCCFIVVEFFIILLLIIQWSLTLGLMQKINKNQIL